jgi:hypothetical protein
MSQAGYLTIIAAGFSPSLIRHSNDHDFLDFFDLVENRLSLAEIWRYLAFGGNSHNARP